jgi:hypothetical protein
MKIRVHDHHSGPSVSGSRIEFHFGSLFENVENVVPQNMAIFLDWLSGPEKQLRH